MATNIRSTEDTRVNLTTVTHLAYGDDIHLRVAGVPLLQRLVMQEADDVRRSYSGVRWRLACLLLLLPVDDISDGEYHCMTSYLASLAGP